MASEENVMILRMLQEGRITAEQAAALLQAVESAPPVVGVESAPAPVAATELPAVAEEVHTEAVARARARIAAARERVAGVQEKLAAAEERIDAAESSANPLSGLADALRDVPGVRSVVDALKGIEPSRIAADARRQARRIGKSVRESLESLPGELSRFGGLGEPVLRETREVMVSVAEAQTIRIRNPHGSVDVVGGEVPDVRVAATVAVFAMEADAARLVAGEVSVDASAGTEGPTIAVQAPPGSKRVVVDLKVFVPARGNRVSVVASAGDVAVRGVAGGAVAVTASGDIDCAEMAGGVAVETASGDVRLQGIRGNVTARTVSGDVSAIRLESASARFATQSGDVGVRSSTVEDCGATTVSGDIETTGIGGTRWELRTVSGDLVVGGDLVPGHVKADTVSGHVRWDAATLPSGRLEIDTVSGDIDLVLSNRVSGTVEARARTGSVRGELPGGTRVDRAGDGAALREVLGGSETPVAQVNTLSGDVTLSVKDADDVGSGLEDGATS